MAQDWEYKVVKAPMNQPKRRQRILNEHAKDGWELAETTRGAVLSAKDQVTLRRSKSETAERKAADRAEKLAKYEAMTPAQRQNFWIIRGAIAGVIVIALVVMFAVG